MAPPPIVVNPSGHPLQGPPSGEYVPANIDDATIFCNTEIQQEINRKPLYFWGALLVPL